MVTPRQGGDTVTVVVLARPGTADRRSRARDLVHVLGSADVDVLYLPDDPSAGADTLWSSVLDARRSLLALRAQRRVAAGAAPPSPRSRRRPVDWLVLLDDSTDVPAGLVPGLVGTAAQTRSDVAVVRRTDRGPSRSSGRPWRSAAAAPGAPGLERMLHSIVPPRTAASSGGGFAVRLDRLPVAVGRQRTQAAGRRRIDHEPLVVAHHRVAGAAQQPVAAVPPAAPASGRERLVAQSRRVLGFAGAGATGIFVNSAALWLFVDIVGVPLVWAALLATQVSTLWNFVLVDRLVYRGEKSRSWLVRYLGFAAVNNAVLLLRLPLLSWLVYSLSVPYLISNLVTLALAFLARFLVADRLLFRARSPHDDHPRQAADGVGDALERPDVIDRAPRQGAPGRAGGRSPQPAVARSA
ncbi:MAG TPA: GtrA family protein [Candidatus Nanopelagicales bacterium]|nr:GtrA family protein [Candidatus Nanopelagicales bacterium]